MAARTIQIPDFNFAAFYYPEILEALIQFKRREVPELTDESDFEPSIQLLRAFALVGHLNNTLVDLVANESTLITARLAETVRNQLRLLDYEMSPATPSVVDEVYELNRVFAAGGNEVVPAEALCSTRQTATESSVFFEALTAVTIDATDAFTKVWSEDGAVVTDHTTNANSGFGFTPWPSPTTGDALYFAHKDVMWNQLGIAISVPLANIVGVWEFYDGDVSDVAPTSVSLVAGQLVIDVTSLLGPSDRRGAEVTVTLNSDGTQETAISTWSGTANIVTVSLLGQSSPSLTAVDYSVGCEWTEFALVDSTFDDGTASLTVSGDITFALPQTELLNWKKTAFTGSPTEDSFIIRFRIVSVSTPTSPTLGLCRMDEGKQYVIATVTQGRSVSDAPLGSSDGTASQEFETTRDNFINESETVTVDAEVWTRVKNFLSSVSTDKHYEVVLGENDRATIRFGDGVTGAIPPVGVGNISVDYRFNAEVDGNVGARTIEVDGAGLTYINRLFNPRNASGWREAQSASDEGIALAKEEGPASIHTPQQVACGPDDLVSLVRRVYVDAAGAKPFRRGFAIEEGFGPKTVKLVLALAGGGVPTLAQLSALDTWLNGDKNATPPVPKRFVVNSQVTSVAFDPKVIDVSVTVEAPAAVTAEQIQNALASVLQTDALKEDGVTFEWEFGQTVPVSRLSHEIHDIDPRIKKVTITSLASVSPADDVVLAPTELPVAGVFTITKIDI